MARSMSVAAVAVLAGAILHTGGPARMEGTWPASISLDQGAPLPGDTVHFQGTVTFDGNGPADIGDGACVVELAVVPAEEPQCTFDLSGVIEGSFVVPNAAIPGRTVVSICWESCWDGRTDPDGTPPYWQDTVDLTVNQAAQETVDVPDVRCQSLDDATTTLGNSRLNAKVRSGEGAVRDQTPAPGDSASVGETVYLYLEPVVVPDLTTMTYSQAVSELEANCLTMVGEGDMQRGTVSSQDPSPETSAEAGDPVTVTFAGPETTDTPTDSTTDGMATDGESTAVGPPGQNGGNAQQSTRPTLNVKSLTRNISWLIVILLGGAFAAGCWTTWNRAARPRRDLAWVMQHVTIQAQPGPLADYATQHIDPYDRDHIINVVSHDDGASTTVEENRT